MKRAQDNVSTMKNPLCFLAQIPPKSVKDTKGLVQAKLCWRVWTIKEILVEEVGWVLGAVSDVKRILCISLARFPHDDYMVWRREASREYLVKSGYKLILQGILDPHINPVIVEPLFVLHGKFGSRGINGCIMDKKDQGQVVTLGKDLGLTTIEIEWDTLLVVKKVQNSEIQNVLMEANRLAHSLANEGLKRGEQMYLQNGMPDFGIAATENDQGWERDSDLRRHR
ncbi:hypothetical protein CXB51_010948 [Gossypium anomalum]|uniref:Uncharacterized protein n=1 Tax=Gossypium anomalum TaxID=47600 RepID=A0A8J6D374_9ROSI|nr:hypothetical protein CXB51_010948 [Gossypium anomalum]